MWPGPLRGWAPRGCVLFRDKAEEKAAVSGSRERKELVALVPVFGLLILCTGKAGASNSHRL